MSETPRIAALIVDDNAHMRAIVYTLLHAVGVADIRQASDGSEAMDALADWRPDFIIVDQHMRPVNGTAFARTLRHTSFSCFDIPIIMLSAHTEWGIVTAARDAGIDEVLTKPISARALLQRMHAVTHERRPFVRCATYVGPDRRRRSASSYNGPRRRETDVYGEDTYSLD